MPNFIPSTLLRAERDLIFSKNPWAIRISKVKSLNLSHVYGALQAKFPYVLLVIEKEGTLNAHVQGFCAGIKSTRDDISEILLKLYPDMVGQKTHTIKPVRKKDKLIQYTLKDSQNFRSKGISLKLLMLMKKLSHKKDQLNIKLDKIREQLFSNDIDFFQYQVSYIKIISQHGQNIYINHVKAHFNKIQLNCESISAKRFVMDNFYNPDHIF